MYAYHYTYLITELDTGKKYIGVKSCNEHPSENIGLKYFSSGDKEFIENQKKKPDNYTYEVLSMWNTREEANLEESRLHLLYDVQNDESFYNKINAPNTGKFSTLGMVVVKDKGDNIFFVSVNDPRYISGELKHMFYNKAVVKDIDDNVYHVDITDHRYLSGELVGIAKNKINVEDKDGNRFQVDKSDPRFVSGELVHVNKNKITAYDRGGNKYRIDKDDVRLINGEFYTKPGYMRNKICINNGSISQYIDKTEIIPTGWSRGRLKK